MWNRREWLSAFGAGAAGLGVIAHNTQAAAGQVAPPPDDKHHHDPRHSAMLEDCAEACGHCEAACNEAFHHCVSLAASGKNEHARMAQMVIDCAAFCTLSAAMIARHSALMVDACRACAEACEKCAAVCGSSADHDVMKRCVESCKKCEASCRQMVKSMGSEHHGSGTQGRN